MDYLTESAIMAETKMALEPQRSLILTKKKEHCSTIILVESAVGLPSITANINIKLELYKFIN